MRVSRADLHIGKICWHACRLKYHDRRSLLSGLPVADLAIHVASPGVGVPVAAHGQGKTRAVLLVFPSADLVEFDALAGWGGDGGLLSAELAALVGVDGPSAWRPVGGENEVLGDGLAEVVGDVAGEPSVELVAFACRVRGGPLHPAVWGGEILICWFGVSSVRIKSDFVSGSLLVVSGQCLVDRVAEAPGERLIVLFAGDGDGGWSGLAGGDFRLPGVVFPGECQCLAVHAG